MLAITLLWAPMPYASVGPGASAALGLAVCLALLLAAPTASGRSLAGIAGPASALLGLAVWGLIQATPLPVAWLAALSPERARLWADAASALQAATGAAETAAVSLSLTPGLTLDVALWLSALTGALVVAALVGRDRRHRRWLVAALACALAFEVFYGARHVLAGASTIWGAQVPTVAERLRGTFINPNHFAGYLEIGLAVAFAWVWVAVRRARFESSWESRLFVWLPPVLLWLGLFVALAFTRSRAGLAAGVTAVAIQGLLVAVATRRWKLAPVGLAAAAVGAAAVAVVGLQQGFGRLLGSGSTAGVALEARLGLYRSTLAAWRELPIAGTGLGSFADVFPRFQPRQPIETFLHAHSDPLELLLTAGIVGALLAAWGLGSLIVRLLKVLRRAQRSEDSGAALAALGALAAMAVHESFDFVLTTPANALTLTVLCGAAAAAGSRRRWRRRVGGDEKGGLASDRGHPPRPYAPADP